MALKALNDRLSKSDDNSSGSWPAMDEGEVTGSSTTTPEASSNTPEKSTPLTEVKVEGIVHSKPATDSSQPKLPIPDFKEQANPQPEKEESS